MSCRRQQLRRRFAEFPLVRSRDGRADIADTRPFNGRPGPGRPALFEPSLTGFTGNVERFATQEERRSMSYGERLRRKAEEARRAPRTSEPPQTHEDAVQEAERKVEEARAREARVAAQDQYEPKLREMRKPKRSK